MTRHRDGIWEFNNALSRAREFHYKWCEVGQATLFDRDEELAERRKEMDAKGDAAWKPESREREVSPALQFYAQLTTSADKGAVRDLTLLK